MLTQKKHTGFESIDLTQDLEETFGLKFTDQELQNTLLVGQVYDLILSKLPFKAVTKGTKIQIFFELRKELDAKKIRPSTAVSSIVPIKWRKAQQSNLAFKIPELKHFKRHPRWAQWLIFLVSMSGVPLGWRYHWLFLPSAFVVAYLLNLGLRFFDIIDPKTTIRHIINIRAELEFLKRAKLTGSYNPNEVWEILNTTISRYLDTRKVKITRDSRFVEDLGLSE